MPLRRRYITECDLCGTEAGGSYTPNGPPARIPAGEFGLEGELCLECVDALEKEAQWKRLSALPFRGTRVRGRRASA